MGSNGVLWEFMEVLTGFHADFMWDFMEISWDIYGYIISIINHTTF